MKLLLLILIILTWGEIHSFSLPQDNNASSRAFRAVKWPNGIIPYEIDEYAGYTPEQEDLIIRSLASIGQATNFCVRFMPRFDEPDYVLVTSSTAHTCFSRIGKSVIIGKPQIINLNKKFCMDRRIIMQEGLHVAGMLNEHQRPDRDQYIKMNLESMYSDEWRKNNRILDNGDTLGLPYDIYSIMHDQCNEINPDERTFSPVNLNHNCERIGHADEMTELDIQKVQRFYRCQETNAPKPRHHEETTIEKTTYNQPTEPITSSAQLRDKDKITIIQEIISLLYKLK